MLLFWVLTHCHPACPSKLLHFSCHTFPLLPNDEDLFLKKPPAEGGTYIHEPEARESVSYEGYEAGYDLMESTLFTHYELCMFQCRALG